MKTKICVDVHKSASSLLMSIIDRVGEHNEGKRIVTRDYLKTFIEVKADDSSLYKHVKIVEDEIEGCPALLVSMDEKEFSPFITITWKEINEIDKNVIQIAEELYPDLQNHSSLIITPS